MLLQGEKQVVQVLVNLMPVQDVLPDCHCQSAALGLGLQLLRHSDIQALRGVHLLRYRSQKLASAKRKAGSGSRPLERSCVACGVGNLQQLPVAVQEREAGDQGSGRVDAGSAGRLHLLPGCRGQPAAVGPGSAGVPGAAKV